ncbi:MAG: phosphomannomutase/phosphoglucomutase [Armatimonadota bacterium]|nr:phosphomannomutase/phosphoglucomutase [Armatimonadota bacterium]MDR5703221.1 phosphomannomutase/phosphoglucomutase [Armatimonadota bacterium]
MVVEIPAEIFREYDIRGVVGEDLTPEAAEVIARAYATYLRRFGERTVIVGYDNRRSSPALRDAVVRGLTATGMDVLDIGMVITPIFYYARIHYGVDGGMMITASHNPPEYNGFKLTHGYATLYGEEIQEIHRIALRGDFPTGSGTVDFKDAVAAYRQMIREKIRLGPRRLRVVVDCGNGTSSLVAPQVLSDLGCEVIPLYCDSDPSFPHHHPDPVDPKNLQDLIRTVLETKADLGLGFDGDGDRLGCVDERGNIVWGDMLMILFWREILPKYPGTTAIVEVKCSQALVEEIERLGGKPFFYRTGHSLIKNKMKEIGAVFTGEMSGHMFFADEYYGYDDAIYAACRLLRILSHTDQTLSELLSDVPRYPITPETRVDCPDDRKFEVVKEVTRRFRERYPVIDVDGVRVLFPDGWGLIRASNTQPVLVLRAESTSEEGLERIKQVITEELRRFPEVGEIPW